MRPVALACLLLISGVGSALAAPPPSAVEHYQRGLRLKREGRLSEALQALRAAVRAYPRYMEAHYALAWVYRALGANDRAIDAFREVIRLAPHSPQAVESARAIQRIRLGPGGLEGKQEDRIAFASARSGNMDIYVMRLDDGSLFRVTSNPSAEDSPSWSPDGRRLAFVSERDGNREVYVANADGTGITRITDHPAVDDHPVWSPSGEALAFESNRSGNLDIYVLTLANGRVRQVTRGPEDERMGDWSPDGTQMAILSARSGVPKVMVLNSDGTGSRPLTAGTVPEGRPRWARGDLHIYFTWYFERNAQVCRSSLDGRSLANVTRSPYSERLCDVSADARRLLLVSDRDQDEELYLLDTETAGLRRLTFSPGPDRDAVFAPSR